MTMCDKYLSALGKHMRRTNNLNNLKWHHYIDVIMTTMVSQITSLMVVYSTVYSDADQRKHQSSPSLASVWGIHRSRWIPRTKGQLRGKGFHLMTSSCFLVSRLIFERWSICRSTNLDFYKHNASYFWNGFKKANHSWSIQLKGK